MAVIEPVALPLRGDGDGRALAAAAAGFGGWMSTRGAPCADAREIPRFARPPSGTAVADAGAELVFDGLATDPTAQRISEYEFMSSATNVL